MKGLLRSVIDYGPDASGRDPHSDLVTNLQRLITSKLEWSQPADERLYHFVIDFFRQRLEVPSRQSVLDFFEGTGDQEAIERLKDFDSAQPYYRTNFAHLLQKTVEKQNEIKGIYLLKQSQEIIQKGLILDKVKKQGLKDGLTHFSLNASQLLLEDSSARTYGNLREDGQEVWNDYLLAKSNKGQAWGKLCGLVEIDRVVKGAKRGELWVHAAHAGELKTTFALNWAYNLITQYRSSVFYCSLEMPYEQLRTMIYVMHSSNGRFKANAVNQGLDPADCEPLDYDKVKDGELDPKQEKFYQLVISDFEKNPEYGSFMVWSPDRDVSIDDIRQESEIRNKENEIGLIILDHGGLIEARATKRNKDYTIELNSVLRDAKKLAMHFNSGLKVPVMLLFQINREGKDYADKNEGRYKLKALSYANEAERSADIVTTTYLNDVHTKEGTTAFDCLKRRDGKKFEPFIAKIDWRCRRMTNRDPLGDGNELSFDDMRTLGTDAINIFS
jgi:replicative DNA helicase